MFKILSICKGGGYRYCRTDPPHPKRNKMGLYPYHRVLMENQLGRLLEDGEDVHHKNEDKTDDRPENLEVKTQSQHAMDHQAHRVTALVTVACLRCKCAIEVKPHVLRQRMARTGSDGIFCSRKCSVIWWKTQPQTAVGG